MASRTQWRAPSEVAVNELLDLVEELRGFLRTNTCDEDPGEAEADARARAVLARYKPPA